MDEPAAVSGAAPEDEGPWLADPSWRLLVELWRREIEGRPPVSLREIVAESGLASMDTGHPVLLKLKHEGLVAWDPRRRRSLRLTDGGRWAVCQALWPEAGPSRVPLQRAKRSAVPSIQAVCEAKIDRRPVDGAGHVRRILVVDDQGLICEVFRDVAGSEGRPPWSWAVSRVFD